jgi:hypothetical protein
MFTSRPIPESHPLHRLFRGLAEHTFHTELGIGDPRLVGYVAGLLARFVPAENLGWRDAEGRRLTELSAMLAAVADAPEGDPRREGHRHVGDVALFLSGVFPEALAPPAGRRAQSHVVLNVHQQGKRAYYLASTYEGDDAPVLRRLSAEFDLCAYGLSRVRREWEGLPAQMAGRPGPPILGS